MLFLHACSRNCRHWLKLLSPQAVDIVLGIRSLLCSEPFPMGRKKAKHRLGGDVDAAAPYRLTTLDALPDESLIQVFSHLGAPWKQAAAQGEVPTMPPGSTVFRDSVFQAFEKQPALTLTRKSLGRASDPAKGG